MDHVRLMFLEVDEKESATGGWALWMRMAREAMDQGSFRSQMDVVLRSELECKK